MSPSPVIAVTVTHSQWNFVLISLFSPHSLAVVGRLYIINFSELKFHAENSAIINTNQTSLCVYIIHKDYNNFIIYSFLHPLFHFFLLTYLGKMFKSAELPYLITFFHMFYNDKPVDWLLEHLIYTKVCNWEKDMVRNKFVNPLHTR